MSRAAGPMWLSRILVVIFVAFLSGAIAIQAARAAKLHPQPGEMPLCEGVQRPGTNFLFANGDSPGGARPPVMCQPLIVVRLPELPHSPGTIAITRGALAPGATSHLAQATGLTIVYVEYGSAVVEWEADAPAPNIHRGLTQISPPVGTPATGPGNVAAQIERWDWLMLEAGFPHILVGQGTGISRFLRFSITATNLSATPEAVPTENLPPQEGSTWTSVAEGTYRLLPPTPALLAVGRTSYEPYAADAALIQNFGPLLTIVESGEFVYLTAYGTSAVVRSGSSVSEPVTPGTEVLLGPGDYIIEQPGVISGLRNQSSNRSFVLMAGLSPTFDKDE